MRSSNPLRLHFALFFILSIVAIAQLSWWVIFQVQEGRRIRSLQQEIWREQIRTASLYFEMSDFDTDEKSSWLAANFPDIRLRGDGSGLTTTSEAMQRLDDLAGKRARMFISEGAFFSLLVLGGIWFFYWALRRRIELEDKTTAILEAANAGIKKPISRIENNISRLLESGKADPAQENLLAGILSNLGKISDIGENLSLVQMLATSKRKMDLVVTDISEEINTIVTEYKVFLSRSDLRYDSDIESGLTAVTSPAQLAKVVHGLLRVAENNSVESGSIALKLERSGDVAVLKTFFTPDSVGGRIEKSSEKAESELSIIRELAETIRVKIEVIHEGDNVLSLRAEIPLLEE